MAILLSGIGALVLAAVIGVITLADGGIQLRIRRPNRASAAIWVRGEAMKSLKLLITSAVAGVVLLTSGCQPSLENTPSKTTPEGISYKVVEVEGRKFIATRSYGGYWQLAGPIDRKEDADGKR
jgi:hypothetical protein